MLDTRLTVDGWRRRHAAVLLLIAMQAVAVCIGTAVGGGSDSTALIAVLTVVIPAVATAFPHFSERVLSAVATAVLVAQAPLVVLTQGSDLATYAVFLSGLCAIALYERRSLFAVGFGGFLAVGIAIGVLAPSKITSDPGVHAATNAVLSGSIAMAVGALAIALMWQESIRTRDASLLRFSAAEAFMDISETMLLVLDRDGIVLRANRQTALTVDRELEDVIGMDWIAVSVEPEYREEAHALFLEAFDGRIPLTSDGHPVSIVTSSGERRTVAWWSSLNIAADGSTHSMVCAGTDITDRLAAEAALLQSSVELTALRRLAQKVASLDDAREAVIEATIELTGSRMAAIAEPDRTGKFLTYTVSTEPAMIGLTVDLEAHDTLLGAAFLDARPRFMPDVASSPGANQGLAAAAAQSDAKSALHQPIVGGGQTIGVLSVAWSEPVASLADRRAELVTLVAHEASVAMRRRAAVDQLARAALVDPLTGVANRRAFDAELPRAISRATGTGEPLALIVMDLNDFKAVNDVLGHEAGDAVLASTAAAWADALRAGDLLARIGGDEFVVLLPDCDADLMTLIKQRLRTATPHGPGASIGGTIWDGRESGTAFIRRADQFQYADKGGSALAGEVCSIDRHVGRSTSPRPRSNDSRLVDPRS